MELPLQRRKKERKLATIIEVPSLWAQYNRKIYEMKKRNIRADVWLERYKKSEGKVST